MTPKIRNESRIFWGCFVALATCAFGFIVRTQIIGNWQAQFNLSETEVGQILAVGFWPFAFSIIGFGLVIDKIGYGRAAAVGFLFHISSITILLLATTARMLYWGTFIFALSNGTVEAYMNTALASIYPREKTKWISMVAAGWPCGMIAGGLLAIALAGLDWRWKVSLTLVPAIAYGMVFIGARFPVSERVSSGVSYREMLQELGASGAFVAVYLVALQVCDGILHLESGRFLWPLLPAAAVAAAFGWYARSWGKLYYFILLLLMIPLSTTELGIDSWITDLMAPAMKTFGLNPGWLLVYAAVIMTVPRFAAGPLLRFFGPYGLLIAGTLSAALGIGAFSLASGTAIFAAATLYGFGKSVFWGTMLGLVAERFPRGGALVLNCIGGVALLSLSVGMVFLGTIQDKRIERDLVLRDAAAHTQLHQIYLTERKSSAFGSYAALNQDRLRSAPLADRQVIEQAQLGAKKEALRTAVWIPGFALLAFIILLLHSKWRARGELRAPAAAAG